jgi:hypothetical protein
MKGFKVAFIFIFISTCFFAQVDTTSVPKDTVHSVKKAMIFSAVVPGSGQVYNHIAMPKGKKKAYWKVPLIYAGLGTTGYFLVKNQLLQKSLKTEYSNRQDGNALNPDWADYDDFGVLTLYNQHLDRRDLSILAVGAIYLIQIADAGVEAHFVRFDISKDLTLNVRPTVLYNRNPGLLLSLNFR